MSIEDGMYVGKINKYNQPEGDGSIDCREGYELKGFFVKGRKHGKFFKICS